MEETFKIIYIYRYISTCNPSFIYSNIHKITILLNIYARNVNLLDDHIATIMENTEALIGASKKTGLDVNTEETR
jgi:hypothetical protein